MLRCLWRLPLLLSLLAFGSCSEESTAITVTVHHNGPVPEGARLVLRTSRTMGGMDLKNKTNPTFPETLVVLPAAGNTGAIEARAQLTIDDMILVDMGRAEFVDGENVGLNLYLGDSRPDAGPPGEDASTPDASTAPEDATVPNDAGPPLVDSGAPGEDAATPDAATPDAATPGCDQLHSDGMPLTATAIASVATPRQEFIATSDGSVIRIFRRSTATRECFRESSMAMEVANALHLSLGSETAMLLGTGSESWAYTLNTDGVLSSRRDVPGSFENILGGQLPRSTGPQNFALGELHSDTGIQTAPLIRTPGGSWQTSEIIRNHEPLDTFGTRAIVQNSLSVVRWSIDVTGAPSEPPVFGREISNVLTGNVDAAAMLSPTKVVLARDSIPGSVDECDEAPMSWECETLELDGATGSTTHLLLDGGAGHWTIVRYRGSSVTAYHSADGTMTRHGLPAVPRAIASLPSGLAYINAAGHVIIVSR